MTAAVRGDTAAATAPGSRQKLSGSMSDADKAASNSASFGP